MFYYLRYKVGEYALNLMATNTKSVDAITVLPKCTSIFIQTLRLSSKHKIQRSFYDSNYFLRGDNLYLHWWLNPLEHE